ncbi:uncharacterized protein LOC135496237 [Lineus longissimus]|uniref:uncharacterized protein LOC135496237 n=1 Tax=Lineus longissimus TaxID=88925 RepID=UPI002B4E3F31
MMDIQFCLLIISLGYLFEPVTAANTTVYCTPTTGKRQTCRADKTNCCALKDYGYFTCCADSEYHRRKSLAELYGEPNLTATIVGGVIGGLVIVLIVVLIVVVGCADCKAQCRRKRKPPDLERRMSLRAVATSSRQLIHSHQLSRQKIAPIEQPNRARPSPDTPAQNHARPILPSSRSPRSKEPVLVPANYQPPHYEPPERDCADYQTPKIDRADYQPPEMNRVDNQQSELDREDLRRQAMFI